jgi:hypothetical protein
MFVGQQRHGFPESQFMRLSAKTGLGRVSATAILRPAKLVFKRKIWPLGRGTKRPRNLRAAAILTLRWPVIHEPGPAWPTNKRAAWTHPPPKAPLQSLVNFVHEKAGKANEMQGLSAIRIEISMRLGVPDAGHRPS